MIRIQLQTPSKGNQLLFTSPESRKRNGKMEASKMQNMSFEDFFPWLKNTEYKGPIGLTTKYYVKEDKVSKFCEIMKNHVAFAKAQVGVRHYKLHADINNSSIFWLISEYDSVEDSKNLCLSEAYIKNAEFLLDTMDEPVLQIGLYKALD